LIGIYIQNVAERLMIEYISVALLGSNTQTPTTGVYVFYKVFGMECIRGMIFKHLTNYYDRYLAVYSLVEVGLISTRDARKMIESCAHFSTAPSSSSSSSSSSVHGHDISYMPENGQRIVRRMLDLVENRKRVEKVIGSEAVVGYVPERHCQHAWVDDDTVVEVMVGDPDVRASKSRCKHVFCLTDKDMEGIGYSLEMNPYHTAKYPMHMYKVLEVAEVAMRKYGSWEGLMDAKREKEEKRAIKKRNREEEEEHAYEERQNELLPLLKERHLEGQLYMCVPYLHLLKRDDRKAADFVRRLDEWRFFVRETEYVELMHSMHGCAYEVIQSTRQDEENAERVRQVALERWVKKHWNDLESMMAKFEFPASLEDAVESSLIAQLP
jgi:hypothetical protein